MILREHSIVMHVTERRLDAVETVIPLVIFAVEKLLFCDFSTN